MKPSDISLNSARGNKDFDVGGSVYIDGDVVTECKSDADSWEPRDAVKGDVARILFYMATRYEGEDGVLRSKEQKPFYRPSGICRGNMENRRFKNFK